MDTLCCKLQIDVVNKSLLMLILWIMWHYSLWVSGLRSSKNLFLSLQSLLFHVGLFLLFWMPSQIIVFVWSRFKSWSVVLRKNDLCKLFNVCVLFVAASVGLALLLAEGSRSNPSWAPQVQTSKPTCHQRDCVGPTEIPSTQTTALGQGPGNRHSPY